MYQRIGPAAFKKDLSNIYALLEHLVQPHLRLKCVHVAGTNGKGSTAHYISSILQQAGFKTGLYTSPHLKDFRERIRVNGDMISEEEVLSFVNENLHVIEEIQPSFFEITVAMAFWYFDRSDIDYAIIETGLGGRLDSTNVITPLLSVITNISLDHTNMLGDTLQKIAKEKAGIIKSNSLVLIGEHQEETDIIFEKKTKEMKSLIMFADQYDFSLFGYVKNGLKGSYQKKNTNTAIAVLMILSDIQKLNLTTSQIKLGIQNVVANTSIRGRWDIINHDPLTIADVAHNVAGLKEVMQAIQNVDYKNLHIVLGLVNDKNLEDLLVLFPQKAIYYFCRPSVPRGLDTNELERTASDFGLLGKSYSSVGSAYEAAINHANNDDLVYIGGSTFVVAEVI